MDSHLIIDTKAILSNINLLSKDNKPCLMVKANGYGLDVVDFLISQGYDFFGVSTVVEAISLREKSKDIDILITAGITQSSFDICLKHDLIISVGSFEILDKLPPGLRYHVKIDTGMNRFGFKESEFNLLVKRIDELKSAEGIFTHLPKAYDEDFSQMQISEFKELLARFDHNFKWVHVQNTLGCIIYDLDFVNMVRPGIGIYGLLSNQAEANEYGQELTPVIKLNALVAQSKYVDGDVGYDLSQAYTGYLTTIKLGYHDGLARSLAGFKYHGKYEIIGKICMCQQMIAGQFEEEFFPVIRNNKDIYDIIEYEGVVVYEFLVSLSQRLERRLV